jgi:6-phosphogluconolactonase
MENMFKQLSIFALSTLLMGTFALSSCKKTEDTSPGNSNKGYVFTISNAAASNELLQYTIKDDGSLKFKNSLSTGGTGTGAGLGDQGAVTISADKKYIFTVNAGDNSISSFSISSGELSLVGKYSLTGIRPISITQRGNLVYVLNSAGATGAVSIEGFTLNAGTGTLTAIAGSSTTMPVDCNPAQISFVYDDVLVISEKSTNILSSYVLNSSHIPTNRQTKASQDVQPFGFSVSSSGKLFVTEASANSALSSYSVSSSGVITDVNTVKNNQGGACWTVLSPNESIVYATNTGSNTISSMTINASGSLTDTTPFSVGSGNGPLDLVINNSGEYLYVINGTSDKILGYKVNGTSLSSLPDATMYVPGSALGLAIY